MVVITVKKCACRWVLQHQHKLKQSARSCYLKVKEAYAAEDIRNEDVRPFDSEFTFRYADLKTTLAEPNQIRAKPDVSELKFGQIFTDHMLKIFYHKTLGGWQRPVIIPFENVSLHPAAKVLHYAIELFEGIKAYRGVDQKIRVFRPELNMRRMNISAARSGLPNFDGQELIKCMNRLIAIDQEWVPHSTSASLYIRPTLIGIDGMLGVHESESALLFTILCPVGNYFSGPGGALSLYADPSVTRAWPGGSGDAKVGSNYGPTISVLKRANDRGRHQVLWLYGDDHQLTEIGTMNIFLIYVNDNGEKVLVTPPLNGLILPGIVRQSVLELSREWNEYRVEERTITMEEVLVLQQRERLLEVFGTGTAGIVSPVSSIEYRGNLIQIPTTEIQSPIHKKLQNHLHAIQYGEINHPWAKPIEDDLD